MNGLPGELFMEATIRQELLGKRNMSHLLLITKAKGCSKHSRGRNICSLNKPECEPAKEQAGFANPVSMGALPSGQHPEKGPQGVQWKLWPLVSPGLCGSVQWPRSLKSSP